MKRLLCGIWLHAELKMQDFLVAFIFVFFTVKALLTYVYTNNCYFRAYLVQPFLGSTRQPLALCLCTPLMLANIPTTPYHIDHIRHNSNQPCMQICLSAQVTSKEP
jgi:hypothetical protein